MTNNRSKTIPEFKTAHEVLDPQGRDILIIEDVPASGNSTTGGITLATLFGNTSANVVIPNGYYISANTVIIRKFGTPSTSSDEVVRGTFWFDGDYAYFAVATNTIKRVALSSF